MEPTLDLQFVRPNFPAFAEPGLRARANFDAAETTYACRYVVWRLSRYLRERRLAHTGATPPAAVAAQEIENAQIRLAQLLGVMTEEVRFGASTAFNLHLLADAVATWLRPGDTIIVTEQDAVARALPWRRLEARGIDLREWRMRPDGQLDAADLPDLLDDTVKLVCLPHCSPVLGHINDAARVVSIAHAAGARVCIDGDGYVAHGLPNIAGIGADIYLFQSDNSYGPHQGVMVLRRQMAQELSADGHPIFAALYDGTRRVDGMDAAQVAACSGIADYYDALYASHFSAGRDAKSRATQVRRLMRAHERRLMAPLLDYLEGRNDLRLLGPTERFNQMPVLALDLGRPGAAAAEALATRGIIAAGGSFDSPRLLSALGVDPSNGILRLSFAHYTSQREVDRLIHALDHAL